jgi:hypothetical protein
MDDTETDSNDLHELITMDERYAAQDAGEGDAGKEAANG